MAKPNPNKGPKPKHQGVFDKMLHGDRSEESGSALNDALSEVPSRENYGSDVDSDLDQVSAGPGASSDRKHQHRKFDKFTKGNR